VATCGLERSSNFGVPWLMFYVHGVGPTAGSWCVVLTEVPRLTVARAHTAQWALRGRGRGEPSRVGGMAHRRPDSRDLVG
jgi:hypothetical protein